MKIPRKLIISGHELTIIHKKKIIVNGAECYGFYDPEKKIICLKASMAPARKKEIFIHEYLHFLEDIYRIDIGEMKVSSLSLGLLQLLDNPKVEL